MNNSFKVYQQTRATRQLAGDIKCELQTANDEAWKEWDKIEWALNNVECNLEQMLTKGGTKE